MLEHSVASFWLGLTISSSPQDHLSQSLWPSEDNLDWNSELQLHSYRSMILSIGFLCFNRKFIITTRGGVSIVFPCLLGFFSSFSSISVRLGKGLTEDWEVWMLPPLWLYTKLLLHVTTGTYLCCCGYIEDNTFWIHVWHMVECVWYAKIIFRPVELVCTKQSYWQCRASSKTSGSFYCPFYSMCELWVWI